MMKTNFLNPQPVIDDRGYNQGWILTKSTLVRMRRRTQWFAEMMDVDTQKTVLEIGCGIGEVAFWLAEAQPKLTVLGTDICVPFIEGAKQKYTLPNLSYEVLDFNKPEDIQNRKFDYIIGNGILHHLYGHLDKALITLRNLLTDGGKIIFMEPNIYNPYCALIFNFSFFRNKAHLEPDEMAFSKSFIKQKLQKAGYQNIDVRYKDFLLPGIPHFLIQPSIVLGNVAEKVPLLKHISQSIFITAQK